MSRTAGENAHRGEGLSGTVGFAAQRSRLRIRGFGAARRRPDAVRGISQAVGKCDVLLAMIGKRWMEPKGSTGPFVGCQSAGYARR